MEITEMKGCSSGEVYVGVKGEKPYICMFQLTCQSLHVGHVSLIFCHNRPLVLDITLKHGNGMIYVSRQLGGILLFSALCPPQGFNS